VDLCPGRIAGFSVTLHECNGLGRTTGFNQLLCLMQFTRSPRQRWRGETNRYEEASRWTELKRKQKVHAEAIKSCEKSVGSTLADLWRVLSSFRQLGPLGNTDIDHIS
jgi:hypothetical protein